MPLVDEDDSDSGGPLGGFLDSTGTGLLSCVVELLGAAAAPGEAAV